MDKQSLCYTLFLALSLFMVSANLNNAQPFKYNNTTNLSTSWINNNNRNPVIFDNDFDYFRLMVTPILIGSNNSQFVSGFYCPFFENSCFFGVLICRIRYDLKFENSLVIKAPELVWSANRNLLVKVNVTLQLKENGDFVLADADGTLVWSTHTSGKSIVGLRLIDWGNLVLFDRNNAMIWQSFDYPIDCLVLGQKLVPGQRLITSSSASNWSTQGLFSFTLQDDSFVAYVESNPPLVYFGYSSSSLINTFVKFLMTGAFYFLVATVNLIQ